jgi:hypothetical protein
MEKSNPMSNEIIGNADSLDSSVASIRGRPAFPLRTLMVCFTTWLIASEILICGQARFNAKVELLNEAAQALRRPQVVVPNEHLLNPSSSAKMEEL